MYIEPNSTIILLTNVPIEPDQSNTLYFDNVAEQTAYFQSKQLMAFYENTYQRVNRGFARLQVPADRVYSANYMMFRNIAYGGKWFYAFVNSVEYINDVTTQINFTIDPIQSWFFEYTEDACFVERMHARSDDIGEHIEPEPVQLSEYVYAPTMELQHDNFVGDTFIDPSIIVNYVNPEDQDPTGDVYGGVYSAGKLYAWRFTEIESLKTWVAQHMENTTEAIINMYMCPRALHDDTHNGDPIPQFTVPRLFEDEFPAITDTNTIDGYVPKNKKLYTYPYNFFQVRDNCGNSLTLRYEFFDNLKPRFRVYGNCVSPVELVLYPEHYKGLAFYTSERLTIKGFPLCSWSGDAYKAWLAQNNIPYAINAVGTAIPAIASAGVGLFTAGAMAGNMGALSGMIGSSGAGSVASHTLAPIGNSIMGSIGSEINLATEYLSNRYSASIQADITKGSISSGNADYASSRMHFAPARMCITAECARRIDDYFTSFGYSIGRNMIPLRKVRTRFTYVKTAGANIHGNLPADDAQYIANCYNRGIRFWADKTNVGVYTIANDVLV